jgi:predicted RNase H-like nuclease
MVAILGIDAAWTPNHPSGVALIRQTEAGGWESVRVEDSYERFLSRSNRLQEEGAIPASNLLRVAKELTGFEVRLVAADLPLSKAPIVGRRFADNEVSRRFGGLGCSTHTPSVVRPGPISECFRRNFERSGFSLATNVTRLPKCALIETYPHPALLSLMNVQYRVPYKVSKSKSYWRELDMPGRMTVLRENLEAILAALSRTISKIDISVPQEPKSFSTLKPIEDKIDALICAWVGTKVLEGKAEAIGDEEAAIWLPVRQG